MSRKIQFNTPGKSNFVGKLSLVGQGGSGKTYMVNQISNHLIGVEMYPWDEEKNMAGTIGVTPYSMTVKNDKVIINDNPGQNSLEMVRNAIASQGDVYSGVIIVNDGCGWNFRRIGMHHTQSMAVHIKMPEIPILVITSKCDLRDHLVKSGKVNEFAEIIESTAQNLKDGMLVQLFDRAFKQNESFRVKMTKDRTVPFTMMEQILVNALDAVSSCPPINGLTPMNIRLMVRSLLLGYCDLLKEILKAENIFNQFPQFNAIDDELINKLNYHRPTAYETQALWIKLAGIDSAGRPLKHEPPMLLDFFDKASIMSVFTKFVFASKEKHEGFIHELEDFGRCVQPDKSWVIVDDAFTNSVTDEGKNRTIEGLSKLIEKAKEFRTTHKKESPMDYQMDLSLSGLGLDNF